MYIQRAANIKTRDTQTDTELAPARASSVCLLGVIYSPATTRYSYTGNNNPGKILFIYAIVFEFADNER